MKSVLSPSAPIVARLAAGPAVNWNAVGIMGSLACLAHCLLLPLTVAALPWLVLFERDWLHRGLVVALTAPALLAFVFGWSRHGKWLPGFLIMGGLVALNAAAFAVPEHWESGLTVLGGLFLVAANGLNHYLCPRCVNEGGCHS